MDLGILQDRQNHRVCQVCGAEFRTNEKETALAQYADHSVIHQPTPEQWAGAYDKIQEAKERVKKKESTEDRNTR